MFKFVSKGDDHLNESALFLNGQKVYAVYTSVDLSGEIMIQIEDGSGRLMKEWEDFAEDYEVLN